MKKLFISLIFSLVLYPSDKCQADELPGSCKIQLSSNSGIDSVDRFLIRNAGDGLRICSDDDGAEKFFTRISKVTNILTVLCRYTETEYWYLSNGRYVKAKPILRDGNFIVPQGVEADVKEFIALKNNGSDCPARDSDAYVMVEGVEAKAVKDVLMFWKAISSDPAIMNDGFSAVRGISPFVFEELSFIQKGGRLISISYAAPIRSWKTFFLKKPAVSLLILTGNSYHRVNLSLFDDGGIQLLSVTPVL